MGTARFQGLRQNSSPVISGLSRSLLALAVAAGSSAAFAAEDKNEVLEEVNVTGELNLDRQTSIGKLDIPVDETPFSISLRDKDFFDVTGSKSVQDILQYSAGVNGGRFGVDSRGDWSTVRAVEPIMFVDGLQTIFGSYTSSRANLYSFERVEILKGPSSVLYGQGSTGGIVNLVSKRPKEEFGGELMVQGGDYDRKVVAGDVTGALDSDGEWLYRVVGYARDADAQVDHVDDNSNLFMPSISWRPSTDTEITLLATYQKDDTGSTTAFLPVGGTLVDNENGQIPTDVFLSEPGWDKYDTEQTSYSLWVDHRFSDSWGINAGIRYSKGEVDYNSMYPDYSSVEGLLSRIDKNVRWAPRTAYMKDADSDLLIMDLRLSGEFLTGPFGHNVSIGLDSQDAEIDNSILKAPGLGGYIDIYNPTYGNVPEGLADLPRDISDTNTDQVGFYVQDQITFENFIFNAGLREDRTSSRVQSNDPKIDKSKHKEREVTTRFGLMYAFDNGLSPYLSYSESFQPIVADPDGLGRAFKPVLGEQVEAGLKFQPEGANLLLTASVFEIEQKNRLTKRIGGIQEQTGETVIEGVELEATGQWGALTLVANYSTTDSEVTESSTPFEVGTEIDAVPSEQASIWANYDFSEWVSGLSAGVGARYVGASQTNFNVSRETLLLHPVVASNPLYMAYVDTALSEFPSENPSYTLYDATIGYTLENWKLQLNVKNLTDEVHTTSCTSRIECFYGERRYVTAEARYTF
ncbi:TonB-dependent siderophore receptor [Microbulbifer variabilis]|uniref:TonB-dependent siderophore receptor n=1 Tax=Microbulbifer variabilis TaxID=266805 RepID=UPI001CFE43C6|nr:TonB-dependent siderophore receptor [Microbulbifer variabilis]